MKTASLACACVVALCAAACTTAPALCNANQVQALRVNVIDSLTALPAASGTTLIAIRDGVEVDSVTTPTDPSYDAYSIPAGDLYGTFTLTIKKALYADWIKTGIVVPRSDAQPCKPVTVHIVAAIRKLM
jgi:hypothetical protein